MNLESKGPKSPVFQSGHQQHNLTVTKVIGHQVANPDTKRLHCQAMWWYEVLCSCGALEVVNQGQLRNGKRTCTECDKQRRRNEKIGFKSRPVEAKDIPEQVLNALRGKW